MTAGGLGPERSRRESRERVVELGYEAEIREWTVEELLASLPLAADPFVVDLLNDLEAHQDEADARIAEMSRGWTLERMPVLDRLIMRLATVELLYQDTPTGVVLAEAVELASRYSTDESGRFVNGVLAAVARQVRPDAESAR